MNTDTLIATLHIMWKGMLGLFLICGFIAVLMMIISKIITKTAK